MTGEYRVHWTLLASLTKAERRAVLSAARKQTFAAGDVLFRQGDESNSIHLIVSGHLEVTISTSDGASNTLTVLGPGAWFGDLAMARGPIPQPRMATIRALDTAQNLILSQTAFQQLCERQPAIERLLPIAMTARMQKLNEHLVRSTFLGLERRLCASLLDLVDAFRDDSNGVGIPLTQYYLADVARGARTSVNQILQDLAVQQIVDLRRGRLVILDEARLAKLATSR
jgi:CRP/FNR family transcriptional regulator, cyclic AMP receptor protein